MGDDVSDELVDVLLEGESERIVSVVRSLTVLSSVLAAEVTVVESNVVEVGGVAPGGALVDVGVVGVGVVVDVVEVVVDVVEVDLSTAYLVGVVTDSVEGLCARVVVDDMVVDVVVLTSTPFLTVILLTANPVVGKSVLVPSMRSYSCA
jgi:hypothetical protein